MKRFVFGIMAGVAATVGGLAAGFGVAAALWPHRMPAPAISRLAHFDEKLRFLRERREIDPQVLAVGSSLAWRQLDGARVQQALAPSGQFLNGATARLQIHQTRFLTRFYLDHYRQVRTVLLLTGLPDFEDCSNEPAEIFDTTDAARYAFADWPSAYFYVRYFAPRRYVGLFAALERRRRPFTGDMFLDRYGSGPVRLPAGTKLGLRYGSFETDPACIAALIDLAGVLKRRQVEFVIVFTPVNPLYNQAHPSADAQLDRIVRDVRSGTDADGTTVVALHGDDRFEAGDFYDAFHFEWPGVQQFTAALMAELENARSRSEGHRQ